MKYLVLALCLLVSSTRAVPIESPQASVADIFTWLETLVEYEGKELMTKVAQLIKEVEDGIQRVKDLVPKINSKIHEDADKILDELKKVTKELEDFLAKKGGDVYYGLGLGILDDISDLAGGTKLGTVIKVMQLAESAHKVCQDAKEFQPKLEKEMGKIQGIIEKHIDDLTTHLLKELGLADNAQKSIVKDIEDLFEHLEEKLQTIILNLLKNIEETFNVIEKDLPEVYKVVEKRIESIRTEIRNILQELRDSVHKGVQYGVLDVAGYLTKGTTLGTVIRIVNVIEKFTIVVQDCKGFGPHVEVLLEHTAEKVAINAKEFFTYAAEVLLS